MRAVYDVGESEDSNTLLVASVNHPQVENEQCLSEKNVIPLPRSSQPPPPTALPLLVSKPSSLSKSESYSGLESITVSNSETRSLSMNQLSVLIDKEPDTVDETTSTVPPGDQRSASNDQIPLPNQSGKPVSSTQYFKECADPHKQQSMTTHTEHDLDVCTINHSLVGTAAPRGETRHETNTTHSLIFSAATPTRLTATTCRGSSKERQTAMISSEVSPHLGTSAGLVFTGCETQPLESEGKEICSVETQTPVNEAVKTDTLHAKIAGSSNVSHPCFMATVGDVDHNNKTKSANTNLPPPDRNTRMAAKFDAYNTRTDSRSSGFVNPPTLPSLKKKSNPSQGHASTIQSLTPSTPTQHITQGSDVSHVHTHQSYTEGSFVGQTNNAGLSGELLKQIDFSEKGQRGGGLACENRQLSHGGGQAKSPGMPLGMLGCDTRVNTAHWSIRHHMPLIGGVDNSPRTHPPRPIDTRDAVSRKHTEDHVVSLHAHSDIVSTNTS